MRWLLLLVITGCALTSRSTPVQIRYFSPIAASSTKAASPPLHASIAPEHGDLPRVRIGNVTPSDHLREDIARRTSPFEVELYAQRRWTEAPETYVQRALAEALFEDRPIAEAVSGPAVILQVEVLAFEEVAAPAPGGRVQLRYRLDDDRSVLASGVITVERPASGSGFVPIVAAIGQALEQATAQLADVVLRTTRTDTLQG
jgi:ABC-type uncharacterized transport system auxiliary subunit